MEPTERLYLLILASREVKHLDKLIEDIEEAIKEGAILDSEYYSSIGREKYNIPILFAIQIQAPIDVVKCLKKYWWKDTNNFVAFHFCDECYGFDGICIAKGNMSVYLNTNCEQELNEGYYESLFNLFKLEFISDAQLRHKFIKKYITG